MKLFFETALQARVFLAALPIGLMLGLCLDMGKLFGKARPAADILAMLLGAAGLIILSMLSLENGLQLYHLLAVAVGMLLYLCGVGRLFRYVARKMNRRKNKPRQETSP